MRSTPIRPTPRAGARRFRGHFLITALLAASLGLGTAPAAVAAPVAQPLRPDPVAAAAPTFDQAYVRGVNGVRPAKTVNLAGTWAFTPITTTVCTGGGRFGATTGPFLSCVDSPADGRTAEIQVPGGGWHKQGWTDVSEAVYQRTIRVPKIATEQTTRLVFGAINHRATVSVDDKVVGTNTTAYTDSTFDLSDFVTPGRTHRIEVRVEGRKALVGPDGRYEIPEGASWSDDVAQGIFRSADLQVFPAVFVSDTFVQTSVSDTSLTYDVTVTNNSANAQVVDLRSSLSSWNRKRWNYPTVPKQSSVVPAHSTATITVGPLHWRPGAKSYWTPNIPYRAGYQAQLHQLDVKATARPVRHSSKASTAKSTSRYGVRFGFRELKQVGDHYELNGGRINFRGDSLQGANYDNIDNHGIGDAYDTLPGFLAPTRSNPGWPQAVRNYQRLNYNTVRIHQLPASPYMLDVADELGLIIQDETAIRGSNDRQNFEPGRGRENMVDHLADLVLRDRNHASVLRWSQANEPEMDIFDLIGVVGANPGAGPEFDELLYQTVKALDPTRPVSTDGDSEDLPQHDDYTVFCHYQGDQGQFAVGQYTENVCDVPGKPNGQGEFLWNVDHTPQGFTWFATSGLRMREKGAEDTRPYTLLNAWSSVIPGVERTDFASIEREYPNGPLPLYGEDNLRDPWKNEQIKLLQKAFNPAAAVDTAFWEQNKLSDETGQWPLAPAAVAPGPVTRTLTVFNDTLAGERVNLTWKLHSGTPNGRVLSRGTVRATIPVGTSEQLPIAFRAPAGAERMYLELVVKKPGQGTVFRDTSTTYQVR